jgi:hypothetical protein
MKNEKEKRRTGDHTETVAGQKVYMYAASTNGSDYV